MFTTVVFAFSLLVSHLSLSNCAKLGATARTPTNQGTSVDEINTMSGKVGREGIAYHEEPNMTNWSKGREGVTAGEEEEDVESKTETYQQEKGMIDSSEEDAGNKGDGGDSEIPSYYGQYQYQGMIILYLALSYIPILNTISL